MCKKYSSYTITDECDNKLFYFMANSIDSVQVKAGLW